jgi:hypothetical protein
MTESRPIAIGGYFELELPKGLGQLHSASYQYQSARAALHALLLAIGPKRVWIPAYICNAMLSPLYALGITPIFYHLTESLNVDASVDLHADDLLIYVNYFGLQRSNEIALINRFAPAQLIFDRSQAFFAERDSLVTCIYSPRKFFGVADGGLLMTHVHLEPPVPAGIWDEGMYAHLITRTVASPEAGYTQFQYAESLLADTSPRKMSELSKKTLISIDYDHARKVRNENFTFLHQCLGHFNALPINLSECDGPLCYPLLLKGKRLADFLIAQRIYLPTYWEDARVRVKEESIEMAMINHCLPLPCDQRYGKEEMTRVANLVLAGIADGFGHNSDYNFFKDFFNVDRI